MYELFHIHIRTYKEHSLCGNLSDPLNLNNIPLIINFICTRIEFKLLQAEAIRIH